jgi:FkbM family methyltransferase
MPIRTCQVRGLSLQLDLDSETEEPGTRNYELWRAGHYDHKEPDTLDWIDGRFRPGDVIFDIGANIGQYSLYAAARLGGRARILAFEPEALNFAKLNRNILLNGFGETITPYPLALSDRTGLDRFYSKAFVTGAALHALGRAVSQGEQAFEPRNVQGTMAVSLDDLVGRFGLPVPAHLKIDVDGIEDRIVDGAQALLADTHLRTVLIEVYSHGDIVDRIEHAFSRAGMVLHNAALIRRGQGLANNFIFVRS